MNQATVDFPLRVVELNLLALASDFVDYSDPSYRHCIAGREGEKDHSVRRVVEKKEINNKLKYNKDMLSKEQGDWYLFLKSLMRG